MSTKIDLKEELKNLNDLITSINNKLNEKVGTRSFLVSSMRNGLLVQLDLATKQLTWIVEHEELYN